MTHSTTAASRSPRRIIVILSAILAALLIAVGGGAFAYAKSFDGKAAPGTTVLGTDVAGKSEQQIAQLVASRADAVKVTVDVDGEKHVASAKDLGIEVDSRATAKKAVEGGGSVGSVVAGSFGGTTAIEPVVTVDKKKAAAFAEGLIPDSETSSRSAAVSYDEDESAFTVEPGRSGKGIDPSTLVAAIEKQAPSLTSFSVDQPVSDVAPRITDEDAKKAADDLNALLDQDRVVKGPDGKSHKISRDRLASWIEVGPDADGKALGTTVDEAKVSEWVKDRAKSDASEKKDGIEEVDAAGKTTKVIAKKQDGVEITNADQIAKDIVASINGKKPLDATFETKTVAATVIKAKAPEPKPSETPKPSESPKPTDKPSASPSTPASPEPSKKPSGEKWIDVNLSNKTVTAYQGDTAVWGPRSIVDGKSGNETVTGSFKIYHRLPKQDMTNASKVAKDAPNYYYTKDVPWVQYFHGGYAFHGAPWRSSFGYSGSHGCINMRVSDAKWLYNWASMGTRVEVHH